MSRPNKTIEHEDSPFNYVPKKNKKQVKKCGEQEHQLSETYYLIKQIYPNHDQQTIFQLMNKHKNNFQQIVQQLLDRPEQTLQIQPISNSKLILRLQEQCYEVQLAEFESLKNQIYSLVTEDTKMNKQNKKAFLCNLQSQFSNIINVGFEEEGTIYYEDIERKNNLLLLIQLFLESESEINHIYQLNSKFNFNESEFPSLDSSNKQSSIINRLINESSQSKTYFDSRYFNTSSLLTWDQETSAYIVGHSTKINDSEIDMLNKQFIYLPRKDLELIYSVLGDLEIIRKFLRIHFKDCKAKRKKYIHSVPSDQTQKQPKSVQIPDNIQLPYPHNKQLLNLSLKQLREYVVNKYKLRALINRVSQGKSKQNSLNYIQNTFSHQLEDYIKASKIKFIEQASTSNMNVIDLHGYFLEQALDIAQYHIYNMKLQYRKANPRLKSYFDNKQPHAQLEIITGKGNNSISNPFLTKIGRVYQSRQYFLSAEITSCDTKFYRAVSLRKFLWDDNHKQIMNTHIKTSFFEDQG